MTDKDVKKLKVTHVNIRTSIFFLLLRLVTADIIAAALVLFFFFFLFAPNIGEELKLSLISYNLLYFIIFVILKIALSIYIVLEWLSDYYEISTEIVYERKGVIFEDEHKFRIENIRSVKVIQGILGKLLNYGTLEIYDIRLNKRMTLYLIHNPKRYFRVFEQLIPKLEEEKEIFREKGDVFDD